MSEKGLPTGCCEVGTHKCQELAFTCECCGHTVWVDRCLRDEIVELHDSGVKTLGCCCGHGVTDGYVQVSPEYVPYMLENGYEEKINDGDMGLWCFAPKSETKVGSE